MPIARRLLMLVGVLLGLGFAAEARAADPPTYKLDANVNDPGIDASRGQNLVWLAPEPRRVGRLLVILPYGALINLPTQFQELGAEGGRLGYHTIVLAYKNEVPIAAPAGCGNSVGPPLPPAPSDCAINARTEILSGSVPGGGPSTVVNVDRANSIENRLIKVLQHLAATAPPEEGWSQFLDAGGTEPKWSETVIAGGSLGAGQAALIGMLHEVRRVALFAGFTDARHGWVKPGMTPSNRYFALIHARDNLLARTCDESDPNVVPAYLALGLVQSCPLPDFTTPPANASLVENRDPPFDTRLLVFNLEYAPNQPTVPDPYHSSTIRDNYVAKETDGTPSLKLLNAWRHVLGDDTDEDGITNTTDNCPGAANPAQADADNDAIGDACDKDRDGDTVANATDNCPDTANAGQADADGDSIGDACDPTPQGTTPPTILVPGQITVDATGPSGATVTYTATATDDIDGPASVHCTPSSGSPFAIGDTTVGCVSADAAGNTANASFRVTVRGAKEQLANLIRKVIDATSLPASVKTQLIASLQTLIAGLDPNKPSQRAAACRTLRTFSVLVHFVAPPAQRTEWIADANRIRAVLGC